MNTVYHFGDSYGVIPRGKTFVELAANQAGYNYCNKSLGGLSNEMILNVLLKNLSVILSEDIVFINFSFLPRGCWYDEKFNRIRSTNELYHDVYSSKQYIEAKGEHVIALIDYYLHQTKDYNVRIFTLVNSVLEFLNQKGVKIYYVFVENPEWIDPLVKVGTNIKFNDGFCTWLQRNKFHSEEEGHYSKGIQPLLANLILNKTDQFKKTSKYLFVDSHEINFKGVVSKKVKSKLI
jgi:hypothetical protein